MRIRATCGRMEVKTNGNRDKGLCYVHKITIEKTKRRFGFRKKIIVSPSLLHEYITGLIALWARKSCSVIINNSSSSEVQHENTITPVLRNQNWDACEPKREMDRWKQIKTIYKLITKKQIEIIWEHVCNKITVLSSQCQFTVFNISIFLILFFLYIYYVWHF